MYEIITLFEIIRDFMAMGGPVLGAIFIIIFLLWALVLERMIFFKTDHRKQVADVLAVWEARTEHTSWYAHQIRRAMISQVTMDLHRNLSLIKILVAIVPLMGLLGTVWGMIEVFDVMTLLGSSNVKAMAAGVSKATIPTMAGMVGAISGVFATAYLEGQINVKAALFEDHLTKDY